MALADKTLTCADCGRQFIFTTADQEYYASRGWEHEPNRCPECRATRRRERDSSRGNSYPRRMYPATCAACGKETEVPFEPRGDRPVYCSDCFVKMKGSR